MSGPHATGVWISTDFASVVRWSGDVALRHRIESTVPGRHRSTGRPPTENHPAGEGHRDEHMRTFFAQVAHVLPADDDLLLIGDGEVVEHFAEQVRAMGARDESTSRRATDSRNASSSPGRAHSPVLRPNADCPADPRHSRCAWLGDGNRAAMGERTNRRLLSIVGWTATVVGIAAIAPVVTTIVR
jgi:hypothetical protein